MNEFKISIFQMEIGRQCDFVMLAEHDLKQSLQNMTTISPGTVPKIAAEMNRFWYSAQSLLVAVANISKLLWPAPPRRRAGENTEAFEEFKKTQQANAKSLRESLNIDDSSTLKNRKLRDHFEHFDERIARLPDSGFNYVDTNISTPGDMQINNAITMRNFNPRTSTIEYHGDILEEAAIMKLEPVIAAIKTLKGTLESHNPASKFY